MSNDTEAERVLARLRGARLDALVGLAVDFLMNRPVSELLDPDWVAEQVVLNLEAIASQQRTEEWLRARIRDLRARVPEGRLGDRAPAEIVDPLRGVLARPYLPERELVGRLIDHPAMERVFKDVLSSSLSGFAERIARLKPPVGSEQLSRGFDKLKSLQRRAQQGVLGGLSQELERQAEQRVREHVDKSIAAVQGQVADQISDDSHPPRFGSERVHLLEVQLKTDNPLQAREVDKIDPDGLVTTGAAVARAVARRDGLREEIAAAIRAMLEEARGRSLQDFLEESGLETGWRAELEARFTEQARDFIETPTFGDWLGDLLGSD